MQSFYAQFECPTGIMGWLVGWLMAIETRERNAWAVANLQLKPTDSVLEIGFGPGSAIEGASKIAHFVAGVDHSEVMVQQASQRNARAVRAGRVDLKHGTAARLPFDSATFDKVFAVNSLHIWPDKDAALAEIWRVLKPGGRLFIFDQPFRGEPVEAGNRSAALLIEAGFKDVQMTKKEMKPVATVCVQGIKQV